MDAALPQRLRVALFPFMAQGHMIPTLDTARLFAARNVEATIITTPVNAPNFTKTIEKIKDPLIKIELFRFPAKEAGLPEGCENVNVVLGPEMIPRFFQAAEMLQEQLEQYLEKARPDCLVAGNFFPWTAKSTAKFNIPRILFDGVGYFGFCATEIIRLHQPYKNVTSDDELLAIPLIPHDIKLSRLQMAPVLLGDKTGLIKKPDYGKCFGVIINSFYELEPDYAEFCKKEMGIRTWNVGPVSVCIRSVKEKALRGKQASINEDEFLSWLDSKKPGSVIYISFGSVSHATSSQLHEIAMALEMSGYNFIWVVRQGNNENTDEWLPVGFEQRITQGKGLIIRDWAPQILILEHVAVGAFVTHCGWNSTIEGITSGVPMVTWPIFAEQFFNEKLVTEILRIGVPVGVQKWNKKHSAGEGDNVISREAIEKAMREIMEGEKAEAMRVKAKQLQEMAWNAVADGGSSHSGLTALIEDLWCYKTQKQN